MPGNRCGCINSSSYIGCEQKAFFVQVNVPISLKKFILLSHLHGIGDKM